MIFFTVQSVPFTIACEHPLLTAGGERILLKCVMSFGSGGHTVLGVEVTLRVPDLEVALRVADLDEADLELEEKHELFLQHSWTGRLHQSPGRSVHLDPLQALDPPRRP